ncbi:MAG: response regulator [Myxococcaceae bacterium]
MKSIERIMCWEDDLSIQIVLQYVFEMQPVKFLLSDDGREAVKMALDFQPDLILMDVMMPFLDGPTIFKSLQNDFRTSKIPVVFMTARIQPQELRDYLALGVKDVIAKPFDPMTLFAQLNQIYGELRDERVMSGLQKRSSE